MKKIMIVCALSMLVGTSLLGVEKPLGVELPAREYLELDEDETFTAASFKELIEEKQKLGQPFILARVLSQGKDGKAYVHYYDAHSLNKLYGDYPFCDAIEVNSAQDPLTRFPIQNIQYFTINSLDDQAFKYLCSSAELLSAEGTNSYKNTFHANQTKDPILEKNISDANQTADKALQANGQFSLGLIYFEGSNGVLQNYKTAVDWLEKAASQQNKSEASAKAQEFLGRIYFRGVNGKNYATAAQWYEKAAEQKDYPIISRKAQYGLGIIYFDGGHDIARNYATAINRFQQVIKQTVVADEMSTGSKYKIGCMYFEGGYGVERNDEEAYRWCQEIVYLRIPPELSQQRKDLIENIKKQARDTMNKIDRERKAPKMNERENNNNNNQ